MDITDRNKAIEADRLNGATLEELHDKYGVSLTQLSRILKSVPHPDKAHPASKPEWLKPRIAAKKTVREMSMEAGVPIGTVRFWIRQMRGLNRKRKPKRKAAAVLPIEVWDNREWFEEHYVEKELGLPTLNKLTGRSVGFLSKRLALYGIERRSLKDAMTKFSNRPTREWLQEHYVEKEWSITKCAGEFGTGPNAILEALKDYGMMTRNASEQQQGRRNAFYGKTHDSNTRRLCAIAGAAAGKEYWTTGDIDAKKRLQSEISKMHWADPATRERASALIAELCRQGKCNPKAVPYRTMNGKTILLKSSWEAAVANFLDNCSAVKSWVYEDAVIKYLIDDVIHHFVVDFAVEWIDGLKTLVECKNEHLLTKGKEKAKIAAFMECDSPNQRSILVNAASEIKKLLNYSYKSPVCWRGRTLYEVKRDYLKLPVLAQEAVLHEIVANVCPWNPIDYPDDELQYDLGRLKDENLGGYKHGGDLHASAPNSGGMPGRVIITHFQKHFWDVAPKKRSPLPQAFSHKDLIYRCLDISRTERESLSFERLLREINFHFSQYGRTSHFAPGFARTIIRELGMSGKKVFDPCCGWGGRLLGAWLEGCQYSGVDLSPLTVAGLSAIAGFVGCECNIKVASCLEFCWPKSDLIMTSPPFFDREQYIGGSQPWMTCRSRQEWIDTFVAKFVFKINTTAALYLDAPTMADFEKIRKFDEIREISHRRHARRKVECEYLCIYRR